ncbi:BTB domain-containing protein [Mycena kentingensis (nom. inval.)]|nr:BTB domain-containing protein [Mycena kentingensis (nom. inval.)]
MSSDERPAKRSREEAEAEPALQRSSEYWFKEGNIILQVQTTHFKIGETTLARHSTVFRDMFSVPLPADEPLTEGCPVVVLSGDTSEDWAYLLEAMYPAKLGFATKSPSFPFLSATLRLSAKYDIPVFRQQCIDQLKLARPATLVGFNAQVEASKLNTTCPPFIHFLHKYCRLINRNHQSRTRELESAGVLSDGFAKLRDLSDQVTCLQGHIRMTKAYDKTPLKWLRPGGPIPSDACHSRLACESARQYLLNWMTETPANVAALFEEWDEDWSTRMCPKCTQRGKEIYEEGKKECWEKLPSYFGLPPWEELLKMDIE